MQWAHTVLGLEKIGVIAHIRRGGAVPGAQRGGSCPSSVHRLHRLSPAGPKGLCEARAWVKGDPRQLT